MPEYYLPRKGGDDFTCLPALARGYIEAAFFTSEDIDGDGGDSAVPQGFGFDDLAPEALEAIIEDCQRFSICFAAILPVLDGALYDGGVYDLEAAGRDFWYTRNGHGVGFWDRGFEDEAANAADILTEALDWNGPFGESWMYKGDNGKIYVQ